MLAQKEIDDEASIKTSHSIPQPIQVALKLRNDTEQQTDLDSERFFK